jgi:8-amino-7-oxononanoate synthase
MESPDSPPTRTPLLAQMLDERLRRRSEARLLRSRNIVHPIDATHLEIAGRRCTNFSANNYLGLTHHPRLVALSQSDADGIGSGSAGLISGYTQAHANAEARIASWKGTHASVLLPSGYQANFAAVQTLAALGTTAGPGIRFLIDKLAHASLIDAVRSTGLPFRVFPHNHLPKLERLLSQTENSQLQVVVTESIFSMDGDAADLAGLAALKRRYPFALLLDEAHASGVYGNGGAGLTQELGLSSVADVVVCTLSKAAGGIGGAVCGSQLFCNALLNFGRAYIYSTSVPSWVARMAEAAINIMSEEPWRQQRVRTLAMEVRNRLRASGLNLPQGGESHSDSPIVPVILGDEQKTLEAADRLLSEGIFVTAIRPPTVAPGTSRLRFTLSCQHTDHEIDHLVEQVVRIIRQSESADRRLLDLSQTTH